MKLALFLLVFFFPFTGLSQTANFEDDFSDQDISDWTGDLADFQFVSESGNILLQQNAAVAGSSQLSIASTNSIGYWEFFLRLDGFSPSDGNKVEFYLMSDSANFNQALNGYMLQAGENGSADVLRLFKITAGAKDGEVLTGTTDISGGGDYRIRVTRDTSGNWALAVSDSYIVEPINEAAGTDNSYTTTAFFGFKTTYSSTRRDKFFFDFKIDLPPIEPLIVNSLVQSGPAELDILFSKDINGASISNSDFILNPGSLNPSSFSLENSDLVRISFSNPIPGGENELMLSGIEDVAGDTVLADTTISFFSFDSFESGDVIINEFLKDPPTGLVEYVELKNTTSKFLNLTDWEIGDNNSSTTIKEPELVLYPDSFLVITTDTTALRSVFLEGIFVDASLPAFNNTTDQVRVFDENGILVDSLQYAPDWGGSDVALERRSDSVSGIFKENWGDSPSPLSGTPGIANDILPDTELPDIESFELINDSTLQVVFTERINRESAEALTNYQVSIILTNNMPIPVPQNVTYAEPDSIILSVSPPFGRDVGGESFSIFISDQQDIFGNTSPFLQFSFTLKKVETAGLNDVLINEFMYDPADDYSEFVELLNNSTSNFDLRNWTLSDNSFSGKVITKQSFILGPSQYVILTPDSSIIQNFGVSNVLVIPGFSSLNNTTDAIVIKNESDVTIDSLTYTSDWGGRDVSLERISQTLPSNLQANWGDSPSPAFGTPGQENAIRAGTEGPMILSINILSETSIELVYDENIQLNEALNQNNYQLIPSIAIESVEYSDSKVRLNFSSEMPDGQEYSLTVLNQTDVFGNVTSSQSVNFRYLEFLPSETLDIVINEILFKRTDEDGAEFVELYNRSSKSISLHKWTLKDGAGSKATLPDNISLASNEFLVLTDNRVFATSTNSVFLSNFPSLNDSGDGVVIADSNGVVIDSLFYDDSWGGSNGVSIERKDPFAASNDPSNWATSTSQNGFTVGSQSSVFEEDTEAPSVVFATHSEVGLRVVFSEFISIKPNTTFRAFGSVINGIIFDSTTANILELVIPAELIPENNTIEASNLTDVRGNITAFQSLPIARELRLGGVVINEIMFDPLADSEDNLPDQTEYIELYNTNDYAVSLEGIYLSNAPDEDGKTDRIDPVSTRYKWIPAESYFLVYSEDETLSFSESKTATYFDLSPETEAFSMLVDRSSLSLSASDDAIFISDSSGLSIDSVFYDESWHNPNRLSTKGIALERIDPIGTTNDPANWSSSTATTGGTPGSENTIFQTFDSAPEHVGISFSPNPFSPDDDGFEDAVSISYTLDEPDYLITVRIFDRYGREVRKLADAKAAGFEGNLIWDGLTDDRKRNRVGIYIVLFKAFNSTTGKERTFKETVVLARRF